MTTFKRSLGLESWLLLKVQILNFLMYILKIVFSKYFEDDLLE